MGDDKGKLYQYFSFVDVVGLIGEEIMKTIDL